jgi:hypothetical protein
MSKLGSIITSALPVATMLICQRACICVGVCVWVLQCEETEAGVSARPGDGAAGVQWVKVLPRRRW